MGKLVLHQVPVSPPVRAVRMVGEAIGVQFELKETNIFANPELKEEFTKINPQHTVPTLEDDDFVIWDSHAIGIYLIEKYATDKSLYPDDPVIRARINQRLHFDSGILFSRLYNLVWPVFFKGAGDFDQTNVESVREAYGTLEVFLKEDKYLVGNSLTFADLACVATISSLSQCVPIDPKKFPKVDGWMKRMKLLPYYEDQNGELARTHGQLIKKSLEKNADR